MDPPTRDATTESQDHDSRPELRGADPRIQEQRKHDALEAVAFRAPGSGELGTHNGLPVPVIVSTTLQELEKGAGVAVTGGGSLLPMRDLIRMASHAHHYLCVYDQHTEESLYLGRAKRLATAAQRLALHAKERGCTRPGRSVPGYWAQVHHAVADWKDDGQTEWLPPPDLDTGQHRINGYHHPERHLLPEDDQDR